jgi:Flp pilus assembly protein TadB
MQKNVKENGRETKHNCSKKKKKQKGMPAFVASLQYYSICFLSSHAVTHSHTHTHIQRQTSQRRERGRASKNTLQRRPPSNVVRNKRIWEACNKKKSRRAAKRLSRYCIKHLCCCYSCFEPTVCLFCSTTFLFFVLMLWSGFSFLSFFFFLAVVVVGTRTYVNVCLCICVSAREKE